MKKPAFPRWPQGQTPEAGISERDLVAAVILAGLLAGRRVSYPKIQLMVERAYKYADAMLAEPGKKDGA